MARGTISAERMARMRGRVEETFDKIGIRRRFPLAEDRYKNLVRDTANPLDVELPLALTQTDAREVTIGRSEQAADWLARFPAGSDVVGRDQVIVEGKTFEVFGPPEDVGTHLRAKLRYVEG